MLTPIYGDLDGDGKVEKIALSDTTRNGDFVLHIGQASIKQRLPDYVTGFAVVDINTADSK